MQKERILKTVMPERLSLGSRKLSSDMILSAHSLLIQPYLCLLCPTLLFKVKERKRKVFNIFHIANNVYFFNITYKTWDKNVPVWLSKLFYQIVVAVQSLSCVRFFVIPWTAACQAFLSSTLSQSLIHWVGDTIQPTILCCPFPLSSSIFPSIRVFSSESSLHIGWPKY